MNKNFLNRDVIKFFFFVALIIFILFLGQWLHVDLTFYQGYVQQLPFVLSCLIFIFLYVLLTTIIWFGPKDILRIAAALLFGPGVSTFLVWLGELANCAIFFHMSRYLGRDFIVQRFKIPQENLEKTQKAKNVLGLIALRLNPLVPFRFLDIGVGLSGASFKKYFMVALVISPIRIFWMQYIIYGMGENYFKNPMAALEYFQNNPRVAFYSFLYFLIIAAVSFVAVIFRRKGLKEEGKRF